MNNKDTVNADDGTEPENQKNGQAEPSAEVAYKPLVGRPRSLWFEFFLGLFTFSIYWSFWSVSRAKDVKNMRSNNYVPWLWFFAPLVVLASMFAYPRMFAELRAIEGDSVNAIWKKAGWFWIAILVISGLIANLPDSVFGIWWISFVAIAIAHILFCFLHLRINSLKNHNKKYLQFTGRAQWYSWWEWLLMIPILSIMVAAVYVTWEDKKSILETLPSTYQYKDTDRGIKLDVNGSDWRKVVIGTYSNGSALVEFSNAAGSAYLLVFEHKNETLNSMASFRYRDMLPDFKIAPSCEEIRQLNQTESSVESVSLCLSETGTTHEMSVSKLVRVGDQHYELLGFLSDDRQPYKETKKTLLRATSSFSEIVKKKQE